jgi:hypothetical protein
MRDPASWAIPSLIEAIAKLEDGRRMAALAVFAHHLTVEIRIALDEPSSRTRLDQVRQLNEFLHRLTSRLHPSERRSPEDDKSLLEAFAADAERVGLRDGLKRGLVIAARNALVDVLQPLPAQ